MPFQLPTGWYETTLNAILDDEELNNAFGHVSAESAHTKVIERLGVRPLLDLGMRLGEGSGAALAMLLAKTALNLHAHMATFQSSGVSNKD